MSTPHALRLPRAGVDPITDERTALALVRLATTRPRRHETVVVLLDGARRGIGLVVVSDTVDADAVVEVAERVLDPAVHGGLVAGAIVASVRPDLATYIAGDALDDADRWLQLDDVAAAAGVELVEWFVLADGVSRPRELTNAPPRWGRRRGLPSS